MYRKVLAGLLGIMMCASLASCGSSDTLSRISSGSSSEEEQSVTESTASSQAESKAEPETDSEKADSDDTQSESESKPDESSSEPEPESITETTEPAEPESTPEVSEPEESSEAPEDESSGEEAGSEAPEEPEESEEGGENDPPAEGTAKGSAVSVSVGDGWLDLTESKENYLNAFIATLNNETLVQSLNSSDYSSIESLYGYWAEGADDVELFFHITAPVHYSEFEGLTFDQYKERFKSMWSFAADNASDVGYTLSINDSLEFNGIKFIEAEMDFDSSPAGSSVEKVYQAFSGGSTYSISFFAISKDAQEIMDGEIESILSTFSFNS